MPKRKHTTRPDFTQYVSVARAALALGVSRPTVYAMIARGELDSERIAGRVIVHRASHPALAEREGPR